MIGVLARCGPLSLLAAGFVLTVGAFGVSDRRSAVVGLAIEAVVFVVATWRTGFPFVRLLPGVVALASVAWSNWLLADPRAVEPALLATARVAFFVLPGLVLVSYVDPFSLGDHLGQRLRLPARPVLAAVAALQRLDSFADDWDDLARVRRSRGLGPGSGPVSRTRHVVAMSLALLVEAVRTAAETTVAMQARGYSSTREGGRTWAEPAPWTRADTVLMVLAVLLAAVPTVVTTLR